MPRTDEELAKQCKDGDDDAFQELMQRYTRAIFSFARQYSKNSEDAEDIAQNSFFKAWKNIHQFKEGKSWKPWLFAIARNTALDYIRKKRTSAFSELDGEDGDTPFADTLQDTEPLAHEVFDQTRSATDVQAALEILHPDHRSVLMLHYHEELTFEEIADIMKKPMNTVKSWHRRALTKMREHMSHRNGNMTRIV
jgi:RNA polymerase sigma-70 factor, ECF subfamily